MFNFILRQRTKRGVPSQDERDAMDAALQRAVPSAATLVSARTLQVRGMGGVSIMRLTLRVEPPAGALYTAVVNWEVDQTSLAALQPGQPLSVKIDPQNPKLIYPNLSGARMAAVQ